MLRFWCICSVFFFRSLSIFYELIQFSLTLYFLRKFHYVVPHQGILISTQVWQFLEYTFLRLPFSSSLKCFLCCLLKTYQPYLLTLLIYLTDNLTYCTRNVLMAFFYVCLMAFFLESDGWLVFINKDFTYLITFYFLTYVFTYYVLITLFNFRCISLTFFSSFCAGSSACVTAHVLVSSGRVFIKVILLEKPL